MEHVELVIFVVAVAAFIGIGFLGRRLRDRYDHREFLKHERQYDQFGLPLRHQPPVPNTDFKFDPDK